ncbi:hypothetical protein CEXT_401511 [Caerostris extrusa]|uniref:Uncharacterized protein n=1 Tax=Caerostris extrusa TaxID=172846 RepID=A0AAV4NLY5_CAEEX|nr:hypothetical protein CEXT_401511 [Caerostris extrusa]
MRPSCVCAIIHASNCSSPKPQVPHKTISEEGANEGAEERKTIPAFENPTPNSLTIYQWDAICPRMSDGASGNSLSPNPYRTISEEGAKKGWPKRKTIVALHPQCPRHPPDPLSVGRNLSADEQWVSGEFSVCQMLK